MFFNPRNQTKMSNNEKTFLKITFHPNGAKNMKFYLTMPSPTFHVLKCEIAIRLFEDLKQPQSELRHYWIDEDGDEIDITYQSDYEVFRAQKARPHLQVASIPEASDIPQEQEEKTDPINFVIHEKIECDDCNVSPIVGFRYKCLQCADYDLCERCEGKHKHNEHVMIRLPNEEFAKNMGIFLQTGCERRRHKRSRGFCPYVDIATATTTATATGVDTGAIPKTKKTSSSSQHEHKKHHGHRHKLRTNILTQIYDVMQNLAEGGNNRTATNTTADANADDGTTSAASASASTDNENNHNDIHKKTHEAAVKAATQAANTAAKLAENAARTISNLDFGVNKTTSNVSTATSTENIDNSTQTKFNDEVKTVEQEQKADNVDEKVESKTTTSTTTASQTKTETVSNDNKPRPSSEATTPIIDGLENIAQFIDPQYMRAGIEILNNFSDMFAKILEPEDSNTIVENAAAAGCPFAMPNSFNGTRKNSTASATSNATSTNNSIKNDVPKMNEEKELQENLNSKEKQADEETNSQADDSDWQVINQSIGGETFTDVSNASSTDSSIRDDEINTSARVMSHQELSNVLRNHIEAETKQAEQCAQENVADTAAKVEAPTTTSAAAAAVATTTTTTSNNKTVEKKDDETIYHPDARIDKAVKVMLAMGFSNEGACLTQLLESVDGNISNALDIMCYAQRPRN